MKLNTLFEQKKIVFSFEVFPPKKTSSIQTIYDTLDALSDLNPDLYQRNLWCWRKPC